MKTMGCLISILIVAVFFLESYVLMILWNWLAPLFWSDAPELTFWECGGIILLINLIGSILRNAKRIKKD